jgi:hypothetical protein
VFSSTLRPHFTPLKDPVPIVQEAGWAPGNFWTGAENLTPTGIRSPGRPARSQPQYRLSYPAHPITATLFPDLTLGIQTITLYQKNRILSEERTTNNSVLCVLKPTDKRGLPLCGVRESFIYTSRNVLSFLTSALHGTCFFHSRKYCFHLQYANNNACCCVKYKESASKSTFSCITMWL